MGQAEIVMCVKVVGRDGDGPAIVFDRLIPCPFHFEHDTEIVMGLKKSWLGFNREQVMVDGFVEIFAPG